MGSKTLCMRKLIFALTIVSFLLSSAAYAPPTATASEIVTARGRYFTEVPETIISIEFVDGNVIATESHTLAITGDFSGTYPHIGRLVFRPDRTATLQASGTFTGTLFGVSGTLDIFLTGLATGPNPGELSILESRLVILRGTGGLANLHGEGIIEGTEDAGVYSFQVHFAP